MNLLRNCFEVGASRPKCSRRNFNYLLSQSYAVYLLVSGRRPEIGLPENRSVWLVAHSASFSKPDPFVWVSGRAFSRNLQNVDSN